MGGSKRSIGLGLAILALLLAQGCGGSRSAQQDADALEQRIGALAAPAEPLGKFTAVVLKPVTLAPAFADHEANRKARDQIEARLLEELGGVFPTVTLVEADSPISVETDSPTLVLDPLITEVKFISGAARFWAGALAGSSFVKMRVTFSDAADQRVLANPEFYTRASAMAGAWSVGGADNAMLNRMATDVTEYTRRNL